MTDRTIVPGGARSPMLRALAMERLNKQMPNRPGRRGKLRGKLRALAEAVAAILTPFRTEVRDGPTIHVSGMPELFDDARPPYWLLDDYEPPWAGGGKAYLRSLGLPVPAASEVRALLAVKLDALRLFAYYILQLPSDLVRKRVNLNAPLADWKESDVRVKWAMDSMTGLADSRRRPGRPSKPDAAQLAAFADRLKEVVKRRPDLFPKKPLARWKGSADRAVSEWAEIRSARQKKQRIRKASWIRGMQRARNDRTPPPLAGN